MQKELKNNLKKYKINKVFYDSKKFIANFLT